MSAARVSEVDRRIKRIKSTIDETLDEIAELRKYTDLKPGNEFDELINSARCEMNRAAVCLQRAEIKRADAYAQDGLDYAREACEWKNIFAERAAAIRKVEADRR